MTLETRAFYPYSAWVFRFEIRYLITLRFARAGLKNESASPSPAMLHADSVQIISYSREIDSLVKHKT